MAKLRTSGNRRTRTIWLIAQGGKWLGIRISQKFQILQNGGGKEERGRKRGRQKGERGRRREREGGREGGRGRERENHHKNIKTLFFIYPNFFPQ